MALVLVHKHLLVSASILRPYTTKSEGEQWLYELVRLLDMRTLSHVTGAYCKDPGNRGLTLLVPITTSHIALHIWDEPNPAKLELDVYSCKDFSPQTVFDHLLEMQPIDIRWKFLDRTLL